MWCRVEYDYMQPPPSLSHTTTLTLSHTQGTLNYSLTCSPPSTAPFWVWVGWVRERWATKARVTM
jgi:hypothetical protein